LAIRRKRRDQRRHRDDAGVGEQRRDLAGPADVLAPVGVRKAEVRVEAMTEIVAVEHVDEAALLVKRRFERPSDRRFTGAGQPGEPDGTALLAEQTLALRAADASRVKHDAPARWCWIHVHFWSSVAGPGSIQDSPP